MCQINSVYMNIMQYNVSIFAVEINKIEPNGST